MTPAQTVSASTPAAPIATRTRWSIDPAHSEVGFRVRHMMLSWTRGKFAKFEGTLELDANDPSSMSIDVSIDTTSIDTGTVDRDNHLRSPDFFDVANHPKMTFRSTAVKALAGGALEIAGELTIRGTSRKVVLSAEPLSPAMKDPWGGMRRGTRATAKINRKDFGLNWNAALELGGVLVGEDVEIHLEVELIQK